MQLVGRCQRQKLGSQQAAVVEQAGLSLNLRGYQKISRRSWDLVASLRNHEVLISIEGGINYIKGFR
jgi:hypothetical protein